MLNLLFGPELEEECEADFVPEPLLPDAVRPPQKPLNPAGRLIVGLVGQETYELTVLASGERHLHVGCSRPLPQGKTLRLFSGRSDRFRGFDHLCSVILSVPSRRADQWWAVLRPAPAA